MMNYKTKISLRHHSVLNFCQNNGGKKIQVGESFSFSVKVHVKILASFI